MSIYHIFDRNASCLPDIEISGQLYKIDLLALPKKNSSAVVREQTIYIRLSSRLSKKIQMEHAENLLKRMIKSLEKKAPKKTRKWRDGEIISSADKVYVLKFVNKKRKSIGAKLINEQIIEISGKDLTRAGNEISKLVRNLIAKDNPDWLENLVAKINQAHFGFTYRKIEWKNFRSRFGHCTSKNELAFCSRLLLVDQSLLEYVIIHELAHIKEKNHGPRFWSLVEKACPDYKRRRKLLRQESF